MVWEEAAERIDQSLKKKLEKPRHTSFVLMQPIQQLQKATAAHLELCSSWWVPLSQLTALQSWQDLSLLLLL